MSWRKEVPFFTSTGMARKSAERSRFLDTLTKKSAKSKGKKSRISNRGSRAADLSKRRFSGTTSVFSSQKRPFSDAPGLDPRRTKGKRPWETDGSKSTPPARKVRTSGTVQKTTMSASRESSNLAGNRRQSAVTASQRNTTFAGPKTSGENNLMDSTWFFPVGATVQHKTLGQGVVLPSAVSVDMMVRVRFANGDEHQFPVHGSEISPVII